MEVVSFIKHDRQCQIDAGEGRNATVFKAIDPQLGTVLAVKVIDKSTFRGDVGKFFEEAKAMYATAHRNVVPIKYASQDDDNIYLAMPLYAKGSLAARISLNPICTKELIRIGVGILHGVSQIHNRGYIHFDLKPSNVLFSETDEALVSDFGQTKKSAPSGAVTIPRMYRRAMPPECLVHGAGSILGDVYQLGLLFYRAVNGDAFYEAQLDGLDLDTLNRRIASGRLPDRKQFLPHVPKRIRTVIRKAIQVDPADRFQSAQELSKAISRVPVGIDWETNILPSGEITWYARRDGRADLEVELKRDSARTWSTRAFTVNGSNRRAVSKDLNLSDVDRDAAMTHLTEVFPQLG